jgi:hypothetical protein
MQLLTFFAATLCLLTGASSVCAQLPPRTPAAPTPQAPPPPKPLKEDETTKLLVQLADMTKTLDEQKYGYNARIIRELREAGTSGDKAFALWLDCVKDVDYDQKGRSATEFAEWKRRQTKDADRERDAALQLQVQWLSIVLMHANARNEATKNEAVVAAVTFLDTVVECIRKADGRLSGHANENVLSSVFGRHYKLESSVTRMDGGAYVPGDLDGIYDRMILPFYREAKMATNLMQAWTKRIEQQTAIAASFKFIEAKEKFTAEKLPELKWGQAVELFRLGQEEPAAQQMLGILRANMAHKNAVRWMEEMTALLKKEELPEPPPPQKSPNEPPPETPPANGPREPGKSPFPGGGRRDFR